MFALKPLHKTTIGSTQSSKIGVTRFETGAKITSSSTIQLTLKQYDGIKDFKYASVKISYSVNTGLGALAEEINRVSGETGVRATYNVTTTGVFAVKASSTADDFAINGVLIGRVAYQDNDQNGALVNAINAVKDTTGVTASIDSNGRLSMTSADGRAVYISGGSVDGQSAIGLGSGIASSMYANFGRLSLVKNSGADILLSGTFNRGIISVNANASTTGIVISRGEGADSIGFAGASTTSQYSMSLRETKAQITAYQRDALGMNADRFGMIFASQGYSVAGLGFSKLSTELANWGAKSDIGLDAISAYSFIDKVGYFSHTISDILYTRGESWDQFRVSIVKTTNVGTVAGNVQLVNTTAGVTTLKGAMAVMDIVETAILNVDQIRADIGSAQQQIDSTINNITTTFEVED